MALSLTEAAKLSNDQLKRGVIETIVEKAPLMQVLPFVDVTGNAYKYTREATLGGAAFRAVNSGYTEAAGTFSQQTASITRLGGDADVDRFIVQTLGGEVEDHRAAVTAMKAKAVRLTFQDTFINGDDSSNNEFDGLNIILTGDSSQEIDAATNGLAIVGADADASHDFFDKFDELLAAVNGGPDMVLMNSQALAKIRSAARRIGAGVETVEQFGMWISTYNAIPLVDIGFDASGAQIIGNAETMGASSAATSIYAVKFGEDAVAGLTNGGVQVYDLGEVDDKPAYRTRIEFYCGLAVHSAKSAAVLRGVLATA